MNIVSVAQQQWNYAELKKKKPQFNWKWSNSESRFTICWGFVVYVGHVSLLTTMMWLMDECNLFWSSIPLCLKWSEWILLPRGEYMNARHRPLSMRRYMHIYSEIRRKDSFYTRPILITSVIIIIIITDPLFIPYAMHIVCNNSALNWRYWR